MRRHAAGPCGSPGDTENSGEKILREYLKFYIDGEWVTPSGTETKDVVAPANGAVSGRIARGTAADVDKAVAAARRALPAFSATSREERIDLLLRIKAGLEARYDEMAAAISEEMGAPLWLASKVHAALAIGHLQVAVGVLQDYPFEEYRGGTLIRREPVGVCGLITPWNWPLHQIATKVVPALAAGCTMILKPAELAPYSAQIWTEILHDAGVPPGVFNLVNGRGKVIGAAMSEHPDIDMLFRARAWSRRYQGAGPGHHRSRPFRERDHMAERHAFHRSARRRSGDHAGRAVPSTADRRADREGACRSTEPRLTPGGAAERPPLPCFV
jgi:hypothetical protein